MSDPRPAIIYLPGAGGGSLDLKALWKNAERFRLEAIAYPPWNRYVSGEYSTAVLISDLASQITAKVPVGPIYIIGMSIGGHFGYAAALQLEASGRQVAGFCAIDSLMISTAAPSEGWQERALAQAMYLLRQGRLRELILFGKSKFWRLLIRLAGGRLPRLLKLNPWRRASSDSAQTSVLEQEMNMRLLLRLTAAWIPSLDAEPTALRAPSSLLRTRLTAGDDTKWRARCPNIEIYEVSGGHHTLFEKENIESVRDAFSRATRQWA